MSADDRSDSANDCEQPHTSSSLHCSQNEKRKPSLAGPVSVSVGEVIESPSGANANGLDAAPADESVDAEDEEDASAPNVK